ncbi:hypothetical protein FB451DRAFT_1551243, partial [Mycena latifolia]
MSAPPEVVTDFVIQDLEDLWAITAAEVGLYGAYLVMFGFYVHVLGTRGIAKHRFLTAATISLFILCTSHCALELATTIVRTRAEKAVAHAMPGPSTEAVYIFVTCVANVVYVTSNVIADSIFIFRCYAIWNFRRQIIIIPIIWTLAVGGLGYANIIMYLSAPSAFS